MFRNRFSLLRYDDDNDKKKTRQKNILIDRIHFPNLHEHILSSSSPSFDHSFSSVMQRHDDNAEENNNDNERINVVDKSSENGWVVLDKPFVSSSSLDDDDNDYRCNVLVDRMTYLYEKRRYHKIEMLGEEIYDRTFQFQD
jgi:hypothetical protein